MCTVTPFKKAALIFFPLSLSSVLQLNVFDSLEIFGNFCFGNAWAMAEKV